MRDQRTTLQTVAGLHGLIVAWETGEGVLGARYDYAVRPGLVPARDDLVSLRATIQCSADEEGLLELSAFKGIEATLNGQVVAPLEGRVEAYGNSWPVVLSEGQNNLELRVDLEQAGARVSARLCARDRSRLAFVSEVSPPWDGVTEDLRQPLPERHNVSPWHYCNDLMAQPRLMRLMDESRAAWLAWRHAFSGKLRELLGPTEPVAPPSAEVISSEDLGALRRDRIMLSPEPGVSLPAWVLIPREPNGAGMLCIHGHGYKHGETVGLHGDDPNQRQVLKRHNYAYALRYAERGYVVINPELRVFGARRDEEDYRRDPCDCNFLRLLHFGRNLVALQLRDLRAALSYLTSHDQVDQGRIGATGLSYGGRLTMYLSAVDERIRCAVASGCLNVFRERLIIDSSCGAQFVPGLLTYADTPEIFGLVGPRPLLLELGTRDGTSPEVFATEAYAEIERIYRAAGASECLDIDVFETGHAYSGRKAFDWFDRWLLQD